MPVRINYNGEEIASLNGGAIAELKCKDRKMKSDILISVPNLNEGSSSDERVKYVTFMYGATELIKYPVVVGDAVHDPVEKGLIDTPTKESTVSNVYPFGGWSLTDGEEPDSSALQNVTEDRTVYAAFTEEVRYYTVNFYDGDTLLKTEQVAYGGSSSYTTVKEGYIFKGWLPTPTNITTDIDCYAQLTEGVDFKTGSWAKIAEIAEAGNASQVFSVGDTRSAVIDGNTVTVEIIGFDHDDLADGSGKAGITLRVKTNIDSLMSKGAYGSTKTTSWATSYGYGIVTGLIDKFEPELLAVVKEVNKQCAEEWTTYPTYKMYPFKTWSISTVEMGWSYSSWAKEGTKYALFSSDKKTGTAYNDAVVKNAYIGVKYLTRTGVTTGVPVYVDADGKAFGASTSSYDYYHSVCFCI